MEQTLRDFAKRVVEATQDYIASGSETNPDVIANVRQYTNEDHVYTLGVSYLDIIEFARQDDKKAIIDIASGINWAKVIDPTIITTNPYSVNVYGSKYFDYINTTLNVSTDLIIGDLRRDKNWLDTGSMKFDCAICLRFLPFFGKSYTDADYKNFVDGISNCLTSDGVFWFTTEDAATFLKRAETHNQRSAWSNRLLTPRSFVIETTKQLIDK